MMKISPISNRDEHFLLVSRFPLLLAKYLDIKLCKFTVPNSCNFH